MKSVKSCCHGEELKGAYLSLAPKQRLHDRTRSFPGSCERLTRRETQGSHAGRMRQAVERWVPGAEVLELGPLGICIQDNGEASDKGPDDLRPQIRSGLEVTQRFLQQHAGSTRSGLRRIAIGRIEELEEIGRAFNYLRLDAW